MFRIWNKIDKWMEQTVSVKGSLISCLMGCLLILFVVGSICESHRKMVENETFVSHSVIMKALHERLNSGQPIPKDLSELAALKFPSDGLKENIAPSVTFEMEKHDLKYYPDAWNKPGRIVLQSSVLGSYVVTFGDGALSVLSYWYYMPLDKKQHEAVDSGEEGFRLYAVGYFDTLPMFVIFVSLIAALFIVMIADRIVKRKHLAQCRDKGPCETNSS